MTTYVKFINRFLLMSILLVTTSCLQNNLGKISLGNTFGSLMTITVPDITIVEGNSQAYAIVFTTPVPSAFTLRWTVTGSGAATDFPLLTGTTLVSAGDTSALVNVVTNDNLTFEGGRIYTVTFDSVEGTVIKSVTSLFTITDDELPGAPTLSIDDITLAEGTGGGPTVYTFTITPSFVPTSALSVNWALTNGTATAADGDFTAASGTVNFLAGDPSKTITVNILHDAKYEADEDFTIVLSGGSAYTAAGSDLSGLGTITNDDTAPTISVANISANEGNAGTTTFTFTITQTAVTGTATTVNYATSNGTATLADTDYITASSTATIPAGSTTTTFDITVVGDTKDEASETFTVTLSGGANYTVAGSTLSATGTITNDDTAPTISIANVSSAEGNAGRQGVYRG